MRRNRPRAGHTLLEIQVALIVLGVALAGLCPILVTQSKLLRRIESRWRTFDSIPIGSENPQLIRGHRIVDGDLYVPEDGTATSTVAVLQPSADAWVRRLGMPAAFASELDTSDPFKKYSNVLAGQTIDDPAPDALIGTWTHVDSPSARGGGLYTLPAGLTGTATWTFTQIAPGRYPVMISWNTSYPMAADATFTIGTSEQSVKAMERPLTDDGKWRDLGWFELGSSLTVQLTSPSSGVLFADAVRIGARNTVTIQKALGSDPEEPSGGACARVKVVAKP